MIRATETNLDTQECDEYDATWWFEKVTQEQIEELRGDNYRQFYTIMEPGKVVMPSFQITMNADDVEHWIRRHRPAW